MIELNRNDISMVTGSMYECFPRYEDIFNLNCYAQCYSLVNSNGLYMPSPGSETVVYNPTYSLLGNIELDPLGTFEKCKKYLKKAQSLICTRQIELHGCF